MSIAQTIFTVAIMHCGHFDVYTVKNAANEEQAVKSATQLWHNPDTVVAGTTYDGKVDAFGDSSSFEGDFDRDTFDAVYVRQNGVNTVYNESTASVETV